MPQETASLWERVGEWSRLRAPQLTRVMLTGEPSSVEPLEPGTTYFRPFLAEFFVSASTMRRRNVPFVITSSVKSPFADRDQVTFAKVFRPKISTVGARTISNTPLAELLPYIPGPIELEVAALTLRDDNSLKAGIDTLINFGDLVRPPLGDKLDLVEAVAGGIRRLIDVGDAKFHLAMHQMFDSSTSAGITPGFTALINAPADSIDTSRLSVSDYGGLLIEHAGRLESPTQFDYLLLRIEGQHERDDWRFADLDTLLRDAIEAIYRDDLDTFHALRILIFRRVLGSPDLTVADQRRLAIAISQELNDRRKAFEDLVDLGEIRSDTVDPLSTIEIPRSAQAASSPTRASTVSVEGIVEKRVIPLSEAIKMDHLTVMRELVPGQDAN